MSGKLFIVSAPSGAGKTTLISAVLQNLRPLYSLERVVTYTSKKPRTTELNGKDYHFISSQAFEQKVQEGFFIEWSGEYGHYYGTPRSIIDDLYVGISLIVIIDRLGAENLVKRVPEAICIWITVESLAILEQRLLSRGTESLDQIQKRLALAQKEIMQEQEKRFYSHHILNIKFNEAQKSIENIIVGWLQSSMPKRVDLLHEYVD